ncbi:uncharacterized protein LOC129284468 isoform X2 [Prosopis cineraria]|uniref:uncharacterized protein LOC129284468 isoform X2 n=1 Tax=Prosopis cineraria TaxID=364024 RepID=UPI0024104733|nr:uncharacterized protein LOC129284468 isoform X2 [Prosopis cineraria]
MTKKVTIMKLEVDLQCVKCYKKVKNVLCKFPQIQDQVFDEKQNIVTIKVVCCNPEKIRDQLCCKGCGVIKSIEIVELSKPKTTQQPPNKQQPPKQHPNKQQPAQTPTTDPPQQQPPSGTCCVPCDEGRCDGPCFKPESPIPHRTCCDPCHEGRRCGPCFQCCGPPESVPPITGKTCCASCNDPRPGGPCFEDYCRPPPCYGGFCYAIPVYDSYGGGQPCYVSRCGQYVNEDNVIGCAIM